MTTTKHDRPVSLSVLWQRWQEIEELPAHDDKACAEFAAIEDRIINQPAGNPADLRA
jgi:hypothetical protein